MGLDISAYSKGKEIASFRIAAWDYLIKRSNKKMYNLNIMERIGVGTIGFAISALIFLFVAKITTYEFNWVPLAIGAYGYELFDFIFYKFKNRKRKLKILKDKDLAKEWSENNLSQNKPPEE